MRIFKNSNDRNVNLKQNSKHSFSLNHTMMLYRRNAIYTFIPKNGCSTLRLSVAIDNGVINDISEGDWIHSNNQTFNATLEESIKTKYSFVILRCPFRRLASAFLDKIVSKEVEAWSYRIARNRSINLDDISFEDFVFSLKELSILNSNIHWRKQVDFLLYKKYSDYFCLENFSLIEKRLRKRLAFHVIDARELTGHGTEGYTKLVDENYASMDAFDISVLKRKGFCPSYSSLYTDELVEVVSRIYSEDIELYKSKFGSENLLFKV
ncbi:sulfotransferase family 2 domain-containing protein [Devosia sp.]|uniref:sulfotransferase family 2 domain-containing protein n=1 Tax=Devosia sp. TaxID=1871048 RepID=UPI003A90872A